MLTKSGMFHISNPVGEFVIQYWDNSKGRGYWALFEKIESTGSYIKLVAHGKRLALGRMTDPIESARWELCTYVNNSPRYFREGRLRYWEVRYSYFRKNEVRRVRKKDVFFIVRNGIKLEERRAIPPTQEEAKELEEIRVQEIKDLVSKTVREFGTLGINKDDVCALISAA